MHTLTVLNSNNSKLSKGFQDLTKDFYQKLSSFLDFHIHCQVQGTHNVNNTSTIINTGTCRNIMIEIRKWGASFLSCIFEQLSLQLLHRIPSFFKMVYKIFTFPWQMWHLVEGSWCPRSCPERSPGGRSWFWDTCSHLQRTGWCSGEIHKWLI